MRFGRLKFLRIIAFMLCAVLFSCTLTGCSRGGSSGKTIRWLLSTAPRNLDPQTASSDSELLIVKNCFTGLFEKDDNGELFSSMVEHYGVSPDATQYTFYLNDNIYWSIYEEREIKRFAPVTAQDFAFAIQRVFTDNPDTDVMRVLRSIKNAEKVLAGEDIAKLGVFCKDDKTLVITLSQKNSALLEAFCDPALFPCNEEFFKSTSGRYGLSQSSLIFNGSFCLSAWGESSIKLLRNSQLENPAAANAVTLYLPKDTREHVSLLKEGDIDAAMLSAEQFDSLSHKENFSIEKSTGTVWALVFNPNHELWKNKALRNSVIQCTDRTVLKSDNSAHHSPATQLVSNTAVVFSKNYRELAKDVSIAAYDAETAKKLYTQALAELSISELYNTEILIPEKELCKETFSSLNQIYQRELSLYFSPTYLSQQMVLTRVKNGDFAAAVIPLSISNNTPSATLEYFSANSPVCVLPVTHGAFTKAFETAINSSDATSAAKAYSDAELALLSSTLINPLYFENSYFVSTSDVAGFSRDTAGAVLFHSVNKK